MLAGLPPAPSPGPCTAAASPRFQKSGPEVGEDGASGAAQARRSLGADSGGHGRACYSRFGLLGLGGSCRHSEEL